MPSRYILSTLVCLCLDSTIHAGEPRLRFMLHGNMSHELPTEEYLRFVEAVKPDMLIMGVFDQRLYAASYPSEKVKLKSPALSPAERLERWKEVAQRLHRNGIRLVGQMELFVVSDRPAEREENVGWFGFYDKGWDSRILGKKPTASVAGILESPGIVNVSKDMKEALARCGCIVNPRAIRGCVHNPEWRAVQKAMVNAAITAGVDGFITNRNYLEHCACTHCQSRFRAWLERRFDAGALKSRFGIDDLAKADLCVNGPWREHESTPSPLMLERLRFARHAVKEFFDDVYVSHGRRLKSDLLLAQWNHMAYFDELHLDKGHLPPSTRTNLAHAIADERWGLPAGLWGRDESFFWYCNWGTTQNTILEKEYAGDTVLYGKLLRSLAGWTPSHSQPLSPKERGEQSSPRPYVINKYDFYRPRIMMAEAAALGYLTNAVATPWQTDEDREVVLRYFQFLRKHAALYGDCESHAEAALLFPQRALQAGDASALEYVEAAGRTLIREHALFDIIPDELLTRWDLERYRVIVLADPAYLTPTERERIEAFVAKGGRVLLTPVSDKDRTRAGVATAEAQRHVRTVPAWKIGAHSVSNIREDRAAFWKEFLQACGGAASISGCDAPWTVEMHAYHQAAPGRVVVHLVNYNHDEKAKGKSVAAREAPISAEPVNVRLVLPEGLKARCVRFLTPDETQERDLPHVQKGRVLEVRTPGFLVYGVVAVEG